MNDDQNLRDAVLGLGGVVRDVVGMVEAVMVSITILCRTLIDKGVITEGERDQIISGMSIEAKRVIQRDT